MNEKEQLEFAAKAAGIKGEMSQTIGGWPCIITGAYQPWQPTHDNGDALWLAAQLKMDIAQFSFGVRVNAPDGEDHYQPVNDGDDRCAALRLAITSAAAEIGKAMT